MKYFLLIASLVLTACSSLPPAIKDPPAFDLSYQEAVTNLAKYKNAPIRWGGKIVEVENEPTYSAIQILVLPLSRRGQPDIDQVGQGRFVIQSTNFMDPAVYKKDTAVTIAGTIAGDTERKIGNKPVRLPLVSATNIYLWQDSDYARGYGGFGYGFGYGGGYGGFPYGGFYGYDPYYPGAFYGYSPYFRGGGYYSPYYRGR